MLRVMEVFCGVPIFRRIATTDLSADEAHAEVDPFVACFGAFFTHMLVGFSDFDLIEVGTWLCHVFSSKSQYFSQ
jgi:hypothetical protein